MGIHSRLESLKFDVAPSEGREYSAVRHRDMIITGPHTVSDVRADGGEEVLKFLRFTSDDNVELDDIDNSLEIAQKSPSLNLGRNIVVAVCNEALRAAVSRTDGTSVEEIDRCLEIDLKVCATPTFQNVGLFGFTAANVMQHLFAEAARPCVSCYGVTTLPNKSVFSARFVFALRN